MCKNLNYIYFEMEGVFQINEEITVRKTRNTIRIFLIYANLHVCILY